MFKDGDEVTIHRVLRVGKPKNWDNDCYTRNDEGYYHCYYLEEKGTFIGLSGKTDDGVELCKVLFQNDDIVYEVALCEIIPPELFNSPLDQAIYGDLDG